MFIGCYYVTIRGYQYFGIKGHHPSEITKSQGFLGFLIAPQPSKIKKNKKTVNYEFGNMKSGGGY